MINPYKDIDLSLINHKKTSLHNHLITDAYNSGFTVTEIMTESQVSQIIEDLGFDVFARTEKDQLLPLQSNNVYSLDPSYEKTSGTLEHFVVLFSDTITTNYNLLQSQDAIMIRAHPGDLGRPTYSNEQIIEQFKNLPNMVALEIISRNMQETIISGNLRRGLGQYIRSSELWDLLLREIKNRNIYAVGVEDEYNLFGPLDMSSRYNNGWTDLIISGDINNEKIKECLKNGHYFWVSHLDKLNTPPKVTNVQTSPNSIEISVFGHYNEIYWIYKNEIVGTGNIYNLENNIENQEYVRFEIWSQPSDYWPNKTVPTNPLESSFYNNNIVGSQPFLFDFQSRKVALISKILGII